MWRFYGSLVLRIPSLLYDASDRVVSAVGVVVFVATLLNREWGKLSTDGWDGVSPWWAALPVFLLLAYGMLRANYERFEDLERERQALGQQAPRIEHELVAERQSRQINEAGVRRQADDQERRRRREILGR